MAEGMAPANKRVMDAINNRGPDRVSFSMSASLEDAITHEAYTAWIELRDIGEDESDVPPYNIQADVPAENLEVMWQTLMEYGKY